MNALLGRGKFVQTWEILQDEKGAARSLSVDLNECEEEGILDLGNLERAFVLHCMIL